VRHLSPVVISGLVVAALFLVIAIGYASQIVEKHNLEKARLRADLNDRLRRCVTVADALPGQMITPQLKTMLTRLELYLCERLLPLERKNPAHAARMQALTSALAGGETAATNPPVKIASEAQAKQLRLLLEDLHAQVVWAAKQRQLDQDSAKFWLQEIQRLLVQLHVEYFDNMGRQALQQRQPQKARLTFERGIQYLRKQPQTPEHQARIAAFAALIEVALGAEQERQQPNPEEPSQLAEGLKDLDDDDWKKNNIY
jgi:hypothetical protein